jgi:hypothetical protein
VSVYPLIVATQRLGKHVPAATKTVGGVVFYAVRVVSKGRRRLVLTRTSCIIIKFYIKVCRETEWHSQFR